MSITVYTYNDKVLKNVATNKWLMDPYNPPNLPANTVRVRTSDGNPPIKDSIGNTTYETATLVPGTTNVYDVYKSGTNFTYFLYNSTNVIEVLVANTTGVTNMQGMFDSCTSLTSIPLFDTSSATSVQAMFYGCTSLTSVPLFDTSNATFMQAMLYNCTNVETGALALYQQASTQTTIPTHNNTFYNCGINTVTGAAELAQIPDDWK